MTTSKAHPPLSLKLKFILGYLYIIALTTALAAVLFSFGPADLLNEAGLSDVTLRIMTVTICAISTALYAWVIYLIHKRSDQTPTAFVIASLVSYGLGELIGRTDTSISIVIISITLLAVELTIALFLLQSKEAKLLLKNK